MQQVQALNEIAEQYHFPIPEQWDEEAVKLLMKLVIKRHTSQQWRERLEKQRKSQLHGLTRYLRSLERKRAPADMRGEHEGLIEKTKSKIKELTVRPPKPGRRKSPYHERPLMKIAAAWLRTDKALKVGRFIDEQLAAAKVPLPIYNKTRDRKKPSSRAESIASRFKNSSS